VIGGDGYGSKSTRATSTSIGVMRAGPKGPCGKTLLPL